VFGGFWFDHSSLSVNPFALDGASRVTWSDSNSGIVADPLYLPRGRIGANEYLPVLFDEPNGCADRVADLSACFETNVLLAGEPG
jgi:hypothetical protein